MRLQAFSLKWISAYPCYCIRYECKRHMNKFCLCWSPSSARYSQEKAEKEWNLHPLAVFSLSFTVLLPQQQPLFSRCPARKFWKTLPVKGNKAGIRSFAGNHRNTWHCPESEGGEGKCTIAWQPNNRKLQIKTEEKEISNEMASAAVCPPCHKHTLLGQTAQPWSR